MQGSSVLIKKTLHFSISESPLFSCQKSLYWFNPAPFSCLSSHLNPPGFSLSNFLLSSMFEARTERLCVISRVKKRHIAFDILIFSTYDVQLLDRSKFPCNIVSVPYFKKNEVGGGRLSPIINISEASNIEDYIFL